MNNTNQQQQESNTQVEIQSYYSGLNTVSQPYLLMNHTPYMLNMKFDSTGQSLYRRDGHKVFKSFNADEKIIAAAQALDDSIYYITKDSTTVKLRNLKREQGSNVEKEIDITSYVTMADGYYIDNMDIITGFKSGSYDIFLYFNIKDSNGVIKSHVNLKTDTNLSSIGGNDIIRITNPSVSTPMNIISHSYYNKRLFVLVKDGDKYRLGRSTAEESVSLDLSSIIPNNESAYAIKAFGGAAFIYTENRVYKAVFNEDNKNVDIEVHSEGYGVTSNKLLRGIGSSIYYYGESSGLSIMAGVTSDTITEEKELQRPVDTFISNFHKVFRARNICYKKDDSSLYIIGNIDCDYIAKAIHWQNVYCKSQELMSKEDYENSFKAFKSSLDNSDQFILEYNTILERFSLHFYDKKILGHFNMRLTIPNLEYDQSSELIFTEDYIATTHSDFTDDNGVEFPVQINTIPRNKGLFYGYISSIYRANIKFTSNSIPVPDKKVYITSLDLAFSITNKNLNIKVEDTLEHYTSDRIINTLIVSRNISSVLPSLLIGFYSHNILVLDGVNIDHNPSAKSNI